VIYAYLGMGWGIERIWVLMWRFRNAADATWDDAGHDATW
jgi:hypothetical protein